MRGNNMNNKFDWKEYAKKLPFNDDYIIFCFLCEKIDELVALMKPLEGEELQAIFNQLDFLNLEVEKIMLKPKNNY